MKANRIIYYFLFLAVVTGGFASMAQNSYGLTLISIVCFIFSALFIVSLFRNNQFEIIDKLEIVGLSILTGLFGLRAAYIHIAYIEWVVIFDSILLAGIYTVKAVQTYKERSLNLKFMYQVTGFYVGLVLLLFSMTIRIFSPTLSEMLGGAGFGFFMLFVAGFFLLGKSLVNGEEVTTLDHIRQKNYNALVLGTGFFLISIYTGLNMFQMVPSLYTEKVPPAYLELVRQAESGQEKAVDGSYRHDTYKAAYDAFVEKNGK